MNLGDAAIYGAWIVGLIIGVWVLYLIWRTTKEPVDVGLVQCPRCHESVKHNGDTYFCLKDGTFTMKKEQ